MQFEVTEPAYGKRLLLEYVEHFQAVHCMSPLVVVVFTASDKFWLRCSVFMYGVCIAMSGAV